jgi:hypothetical protein
MLPKSLHPFLLVGLAATLQPHIAYAQGGGAALSLEEDRRRTLYQQGKEAIRAQRWVDAKNKLTDAWTIRPSYDVALSLSQAEFNLDHFAESAQYLAYYFRNVSAKENENNLANAKQAFEAAKAKVGSVAVTAPRGAEILVDGKVVGTAPMDTNAFVRPGERIFEARLGEAKTQQEVQAVAGQEQQISLKFAEPSNSVGPAASASTTTVDAGLPEGPSAPPSPVERSDTPSSVVPLIVGGSIVLVGAGLGIGYRVAASSKFDDLQALKKRNGANGCNTGAAVAADCKAASSAGESVDARRNISTASFVVAGAALVGTAVYWLWPRSSTASAAAGRRSFFVSGAPAPHGGSLFFSGSF